MGDIGRFDVGHAIKQLLELSGPYDVAIGEGIVPTIEIEQLHTTPFAIALPWSRRVGRSAAIGEFTFIFVEAGAGLPPNAYISVEQIWITAPLTGVYVEPFLRSAVPALTAAVSLPGRLTRQPYRGTASEAITAEVQVTSGTSASAGSTLGGGYIVCPTETVQVKWSWAIQAGGVLALQTLSTNTTLEATFFGRIHLSTAK